MSRACRTHEEDAHEADEPADDQRGPENGIAHAGFATEFTEVSEKNTLEQPALDGGLTFS